MIQKKDARPSSWENFALPQFGKYAGSPCDVLVIGAGMAGISTAYQLSQEGLKVILIDGAEICSGQSHRTTAHLTEVMDDRYQYLIRLHGKDKIQKIAEGHRRAIELIEQRIKTEKIECEFKRVDSYLFLGPSDEENLLHDEIKLMQDCGIDAREVKEVPLIDYFIPGIFVPYQAEMHPLKYLNGLLLAFIKNGGEVFENSHVTSIKHIGAGQNEVEFDHGTKGIFKKIVVATHSPIHSTFSIHTKQFAYRTYVIAFEVTKEVFSTAEKSLLYDTCEPYHYARFAGDLFLVGGCDHRTGQKPIEDPFVSLEKWARKFFDFLGEARYRWSGQILESMDELPFIGADPGDAEDIFMITGMGGMGMTYATLGSEIIADAIMGRQNEWTQIFAPGRFNLKASPEYLKQNANTAAQFLRWAAPGEVHDDGEILLDQGAIRRHHTEMLAVYKNIENKTSIRSARCTHLGGLVQWNDKEKTWDCPCHGSRFKADGDVIDGPATHCLATPKESTQEMGIPSHSLQGKNLS